MNVLLTGGSSMLGHYLMQVFKDDNIVTLGRNPECDVYCNLLTDQIPELREKLGGIDIVVHAAGTEEEPEAMNLNLYGTQRLIKALRDVAVKNFVFISSSSVYGDINQTQITEEHRCITSTKAGQSKFLAERELEKYAASSNVALTILRPGIMFGMNMHGRMESMYRDVGLGRYIQIRESDARRSVVTALDVAQCVKAISGQPGIFNICDGKHPTLLQLAEAMSANRSEYKHMPVVPLKPAKFIARIGDRISCVGKYINTEKIAEQMRCFTLDNVKIATATGHLFYDTLKVIGREEKDYPYEED